MENYKEFTRLYPVQKTLRMGLQPVNKTLEHIQNDEVLAKDEVLADNYVVAKNLLDKYHKNLINDTLSNLNLDNSLLEEYTSLLKEPQDKQRDARIQKIQDSLRLSIGKAFSAREEYPLLWKKEMFSTLLPSFLTEPEELDAVARFANHVGYFTDYNLIRKNLYETKALTGTVAYRLIHDNYPIFVQNMNVVRMIAENECYQPLQDDLKNVYDTFSEYLNVESLEEMFQVPYYTKMLSQTQIDVYNLILGGNVVEDGTKQRGLNEYIQIFNSRNPELKKVPKLLKMKKMILSDRESLSWLPARFETDNELITAVADCYDSIQEVVEGTEETGLMELVHSIGSFDLNGIFISAKNLNRFSNAVFGKFNLMKEALVEVEKKNVRRTKKTTDEMVYAKAEALFRKYRNFSINRILEALETEDEKNAERLHGWLARKGEYSESNIFVQVKVMRNKAKDVLDYVYPDNKSLLNDSKSTAAIKDLLDKMKELRLFVQLFIPDGDEKEMDTNFYNQLLPGYETLCLMVPLYNMVRNYLTRKPYSEKKMKLNFSYSSLMSGWDADKVNTNGAFLLRKKEDIFLAIIRKGSRLDIESLGADELGNNYSRIYYKQMTGAFRMLPKIFFSKKWLDAGTVVPPSGFMEKYNANLHLKGENFDLDFCHEVIDYFKKCCLAYDKWSCYNLRFSDTENYKDISQFYAELEKQTYSISMQEIADTVIESLVDTGNIYLFKIYNRDLSSYSKGRKQLQTLYYQMLFDERNLADLVIKLNGGAAMYYRKASLHPQKPTHPAGEPVQNKNPLNTKKENTFSYGLTKNYRYTVDTFHFHFPVTINCNSQGSVGINSMANKYIKEAENLHIIGINRGERNLLYVSVVDLQGRIIEQQSLNVISNDYKDNNYKTDYHELLTRREEERKQARESWMAVKNIAELKEGYLSAALHKVVELLYKYNAVIAIEDLDGMFKQSRRCIEYEIYQKFEDMLVNKLNYLVDKKKDVLECGGALRGLQLTAKAEDMGNYTKQNGFLFRVPNWYIGKTCPVTGFVNFLNPRYKNVNEARDFFGKFIDISYNQEKGWFEFLLDYKKFTDKIGDSRTEWTICTFGKRLNRGESVDLNRELVNLFTRHGINFHQDLQQQIVRQNSKEFFENLLMLLNLTLQMRNESNEGTGWLISPVKDENGHVFCSLDGDDSLPVCGDANDAYNIARKCLMFIQQIRQSDDDFVKLSITNEQWMQFVQ